MKKLLKLSLLLTFLLVFLLVLDHQRTLAQDYSCPGGQGCGCDWDDECSSGNCTDGGYCSEPAGNGNFCSGDNECASGYCGTNGVCTDPSPNGLPCSGRGANSECASGYCNGSYCENAPEAGDPCNEGEGFIFDESCGEGLFCQGGTCVTQGGGGMPCGDHHECLSGMCSSGRCTEGNKAAGEPCSSYTECATFNCINGQCAYGRLNGEQCEQDATCASGFCDNGVCRSGGGKGVQPTPTSPQPTNEPGVRVTSTPTPKPADRATPTPTPKKTPTPTPKPAATATPAPTPTGATSIKPGATSTPTPTPKKTPTPTPKPTSTPRPPTPTPTRAPSTPTTSPTRTPTPTPTVAPTPKAWSQIKGGDVHSNCSSCVTGIDFSIPSGQYLVQGAGSVISAVADWISPSSSRIHSDPFKRWRVRQYASSPLYPNYYDFEYYVTKLANKIQGPYSNLQQSLDPQTGYVRPFSRINNNSTIINNGNKNYFPDNQPLVILIDGDLRFDLTTFEGKKVLFIVSGDVNLQKSVETLKAGIIADGEFDSSLQPSSNDPLSLIGFVHTFSEFLLNRERGTNQDPAEIFQLNPGIYHDFAPLLGENKVIWLETK